MKTRSERIKIVAIAFGVFIIAIFGKLVYTMLDEQIKGSKKPIAEYAKLFTAESQAKLKILATVTTRHGQITSNYIYDGRFNIFVSKITLDSDRNDLNTILRYSNEPSHISMEAVYSTVANYNMEMKVKSGTSALVSVVHFRVGGDFEKKIKGSNNFHCYYCRFKTLSISLKLGASLFNR